MGSSSCPVPALPEKKRLKLKTREMVGKLEVAEAFQDASCRRFQGFISQGSRRESTGRHHVLASGLHWGEGQVRSTCGRLQQTSERRCLGLAVLCHDVRFVSGCELSAVIDIRRADGHSGELKDTTAEHISRYGDLNCQLPDRARHQCGLEACLFHLAKPHYVPSLPYSRIQKRLDIRSMWNGT